MAVPPSSSLARLLGLLEAHNPHLLVLLQAQTETEFVAATEGAIALVDSMSMSAAAFGSALELYRLRPGSLQGALPLVSQLVRYGMAEVASPMLTAAVTTTETPLVKRTTTITKGRLVWSSPTTIVATLENGENRQYTVPPGFKFTVEGKQLGTEELRPGMILTGTNVTEEPVTLITEQTVVYGTEPKK